MSGSTSSEQEVLARLSAIEGRLSQLEAALGGTGHDAEAGARQDTHAPSTSTDTQTAPATGEAPANPALVDSGEGVTATRLMAWGAGLAFLLAAVYFIKLVYDAGWLTPARQIGVAMAAGALLVVGGLAFSRHDREYAAYMPAVGIAVLYLTLFSGHLYYGLYGAQVAVVAVAIISVVALLLGRHFDSGMYSLFAVVGSYLVPMMVQVGDSSVTDFVIYFSAWSLLFSFVAIQEGRRSTYMVAMFFALMGFDFVWRLNGGGEWIAVVIYQAVQFFIFTITAVLFSRYHRQPMDATVALVHGVALFYFYVIEYMLLKQYAPAAAAPIALGSAVVVLLAYLSARGAMKALTDHPASGVLVSAYCAMVTAHVVFIEYLPPEYTPWAALLMPVILGLLQTRLGLRGAAAVPVLLVSAGIFVLGYLYALISGVESQGVPNSELLLFLYAAVLYVSYGFFRRNRRSYRWAPVMLYAAHSALLVATLKVFDSGLLISVSWASLAIVLLVIALRLEDRVLGQSSLLIFAASGLKVLLFDLTDSTPGVRVAVLVVLSASLYAGGWLYQKISRKQVKYHEDAEVNRQLNTIKHLVDDGLDDVEIVAYLKKRGVPCLAGDEGWQASLVEQITRDFGFRSRD